MSNSSPDLEVPPSPHPVANNNNSNNNNNNDTSQTTISPPSGSCASTTTFVDGSPSMPRHHTASPPSLSSPREEENIENNNSTTNATTAAAAASTSHRVSNNQNQSQDDHHHHQQQQQQQQDEESTDTEEDDDEDADNPLMPGANGNTIRRPLGTKNEIKELVRLSRSEADYSFADAIAADPNDNYKSVTWTQIKENIGFEREAHGLKVVGTISQRDQQNWDKIKHISVRDADGVEASLFFYDNDPDFNTCGWRWEDIQVGSSISVRSPRYHRFMDGNEGMRVTSCNALRDVSRAQNHMADARRLEFGKMHKENGNKKWRERRYDEAVDQYDQAIRYLRGSFTEEKESEAEAKELAAICFLNVAACFIQQKKFMSVEAPCRQALLVNVSPFWNAKAYFRIGQAQFQLGNYVQAQGVLERAAQLHADARIVEELNKVRDARGLSIATASEIFRTRQDTTLERLCAQQEEAEERRRKNSNSGGGGGNESAENEFGSSPTRRHPASTSRGNSPAATPSPLSLSDLRVPAAAAAATTRSSHNPNKDTIAGGGAASSASPAAAAAVSNNNQHNNQNNTQQPNQKNQKAKYRFGYRVCPIRAAFSSGGLQDEFDAVENIRDLGGLPVVLIQNQNNNNNQSGGDNAETPATTATAASPSPPVFASIRRHMLYRSASLISATKNDLSLLSGERLGLKTVIDLRESSEFSNAVEERKAFVEAENIKRKTKRLEIARDEIKRRESTKKMRGPRQQQNQQQDHGGGGGGGGENWRRKKNKKLRNSKMFSVDPSSSSSDDEEEEESSSDDEIPTEEEFDEFLKKKEAGLRPLEFVDHENYFTSVTVTCKTGRVGTYDAPAFVAEHPNIVVNAGGSSVASALLATSSSIPVSCKKTSSAAVSTFAEWMRQRPVSLHVDLSSKTVYALSPWWVWLLVLLLALFFQIKMAAWLVVQTTAARVGAVSYYRALLAHQREEIREIFRILADAKNYPILVCCQMGKDRTGVLVALVLLLCGVPKEHIVRDYARTTVSKQMEKHCAEDLGLTAEEWTRALPQTMEKFLDELLEEFDGVQGLVEYVMEMGVEKAEIESIRMNLVAT